MRKMLTIVLTVVLCFTVTPVLAIKYGKDFLETGNPGGQLNSQKTFDEDITINTGQNFDVDIWLNDAPSDMLSGGFWVEFNPAQISITDVKVYDGDSDGSQGGGGNPCCIGLPGPWDPTATTQVPDASGPGTYFVAVTNFGCVTRDAAEDIILGRVSFKSISSGAATITVKSIPGFDTLVACEDGVVYDSQITPNTITISQGSGTSTTTSSPSTTTGPSSTTSTSPSTTTGPGSTTSTPPSTTSSVDGSTTTTTASNRWQLVYTNMWAAEANKKLALLRSFRDEVMSRNESGRNYISALYRHSEEIAAILIRNPLLCLETGKLIDSLLPNVESSFQTRTLNLTLAQRDSIASVLESFEAKAGTPLQEFIKQVKDDLEESKIVL